MYPGNPLLEVIASKNWTLFTPWPSSQTLEALEETRQGMFLVAAMRSNERA
jgi:hypothetical protein